MNAPLYPYPASVSEAAQILDKDKPDWYTKIDLTIFDMTDAHRCVLGQVYGEYYDNIVRLTDGGGTIWSCHTNMWLGEIQDRLDKDNMKNTNRKSFSVNQSSDTLAEWELGAAFSKFLEKTSINSQCDLESGESLANRHLMWEAFKAGYSLNNKSATAR